MLKPLLAALLVGAIAVPAASAGPVERAGRFDKRLTAAEYRGAWAQGSRADHAEDRFDHREDVRDRRESRRDEAVDFGPRDVIEDRIDRRESHRDRLENRVDRRH
ncbi:MAG: hypothetical protein R3C13_00675 [Hyphomonas sp.]|uniref:hypothetical protein n=1 Tax=Hyphomonas sp. TaxID=87 RepID=UPI0035273941